MLKSSQCDFSDSYIPKNCAPVTDCMVIEPDNTEIKKYKMYGYCGTYLNTFFKMRKMTL